MSFLKACYPRVLSMLAAVASGKHAEGNKHNALTAI